MPSTVTAFHVKIASPGDAGMELFLAREVIGDWNARHTLSQKRVLLPLDESTDGGSSDLLIAFFCAAQGAPDDEASTVVERQIEKQLEASRPALIYFSEGRADLRGISIHQAEALAEFKKRFHSQATAFGDEKELRAKLSRQLEELVANDPAFRVAAAEATAAISTPEKHPAAAPDLSKHAQALLINACDDPEAYIGLFRDPAGLKIQVNGRQMVEPGDVEAAAMWEKAFHELLDRTFIRDAGMGGRLFQISSKGFEFLETLGKYPIGYIAELGGM